MSNTNLTLPQNVITSHVKTISQIIASRHDCDFYTCTQSDMKAISRYIDRMMDDDYCVCKAHTNLKRTFNVTQAEVIDNYVEKVLR